MLYVGKYEVEKAFAIISEILRHHLKTRGALNEAYTKLMDDGTLTIGGQTLTVSMIRHEKTKEIILIELSITTT